MGDLSQTEAFCHPALGFDKMVWDYPGALLSWELVVPRTEDAVAAADSLTRSGDVVQSESGALVASDPWGLRLRLVHG